MNDLIKLQKMFFALNIISDTLYFPALLGFEVICPWLRSGHFWRASQSFQTHWKRY
jgi:hypothetical protein